jgi:hypothetical protein
MTLLDACLCIREFPSPVARQAAGRELAHVPSVPADGAVVQVEQCRRDGHVVSGERERAAQRVRGAIAVAHEDVEEALRRLVGVFTLHVRQSRARRRVEIRG